MVNEQRALRRVGEWAGLNEDDLESYLDIAHHVHNERLQDVGDEYELHRQYFRFLNNEVFSDYRVLRVLDDLGVGGLIALFHQGTIDVEATFKSYAKVDYDLDEIVDFVMMLKFIHDYSQKTGEETIAPRNRLQHLLYLVNYQLSQEPDPFLPERENEWGLLWRTGYRYDFRRLDTGPGASWLYTDKDRLYAWQLLDEEVQNTSLSDINEPFGISLGQAGHLLMKRYNKKLQGFDSMVLSRWDQQQQKVIEEFGELSQSDLWEHITEMNQYQQRRKGELLLNGRPLQFDEAAREELHEAKKLMPIHA